MKLLGIPAILALAIGWIFIHTSLAPWDDASFTISPVQGVAIVALMIAAAGLAAVVTIHQLVDRPRVVAPLCAHAWWEGEALAWRPGRGWTALSYGLSIAALLSAVVVMLAAPPELIFAQGRRILFTIISGTAFLAGAVLLFLRARANQVNRLSPTSFDPSTPVVALPLFANASRREVHAWLISPGFPTPELKQSAH